MFIVLSVLKPKLIIISYDFFVLFSLQQLRKQSRFNARKKFQFAILVIRAVIRIRRLRYTAEPLHVEEAIRDPYRVKVLRKVSKHHLTDLSKAQILQMLVSYAKSVVYLLDIPIT